ncbi:MAG: glycosyltransferase family 2 protein [Verrucomicrobiota bacterium]
MSTPLVSICTPTYNRPDFLERAIRSCLAQTYQNFEIIVTDNSTNDSSEKLISRLSDPRIRYFKNEKNLGPVGNTNRATALARGKYIKILMDDDLLKPRCLELMVEALEKNPSAGVAMAPMELIDVNDQRIYPRFYVFRKMEYRYRYRVGDGLVDKRTVLKDFLTRDYPCTVPSGVMMRAECFQRFGLFDEKADFAGDLDKVMQIATESDFYYIDQVLSSWRLMTDNHTASLHQSGLNIGAFYYITRKILEQTKALELFPADEREKIIRDSIFFCSCRALLNGLAGIRARSPKLILETIKTIFREDKYFVNKLRLPIFALREIFVSFFPKHQPPARE